MVTLRAVGERQRGGGLPMAVIAGLVLAASTTAAAVKVGSHDANNGPLRYHRDDTAWSKNKDSFPSVREAADGDDSGQCMNNPWPDDRQHNRLPFGATLAVGGILFSKNSLLSLKSNGQLVLSQKKDGRVLWMSPAVNTTGGYRPDGTPETVSVSHATVGAGGLEIVGTTTDAASSADGSSTHVLWSSHTAGTPPTAILVLVDSCDLVLFNAPPFDTTLWSTETGVCLDVHVVPHSHDDVGWLLTPERYYDGCYNPQGGVQSIIRTMVEALYRDPTRTFVQTEQYFFHRWWVRQDAAMKAKVRTIVKRGQFIFVNGGWSMHDEACVHHESAINNMARGAQFIREEFGHDANVTVGWHLDPFGHASATPRMMAQMGFNSFWFQRTDHQHREQMINTRTLETMWDSSPSLGAPHYMFTSIMADGYCKGCELDMCPSSYCCYTCEDAANGDPAWVHELVAAKLNAAPTTDAEKVRRLFRIQNDQPLTIKAMAKGVVESYRKYATYFRTDQVMIPWGCDFEHINAAESFALMDEVFAAIRNDSSLTAFNVFYSHPQNYTDAVLLEGYKWPVNKDDYFLDSDDGHSYWSGYFSSRAEFKRWERVLMNQMTTADMLLSTLQPDTSTFQRRWDDIDALRQAMGVAQHHDSITGTERQSVCNQYQKIMHEGSVVSARAELGMVEEATGFVAPAVCELANLSSCLHTNILADGKEVRVLLYNPLAWNRTEYITVPIPVKAASVKGPDGLWLPSQVQDTWAMTRTPDPQSPSPLPSPSHPYEIIFEVTMAPMSFTAVAIVPSGPGLYIPSRPLTGNVTLQSQFVYATISATKGLMMMANTFDTTKVQLSQGYYWYTPMNNSNGQQAAGAYIFRPNPADAEPAPFASSYTNATIVEGTLCSEVRWVVDGPNKIHQAIRLCMEDHFVAIQTGIGAIDAGRDGKEVVMRLRSDIESSGVWHTDGQGLEMIKRVRNHRPNYNYTITEPVAGNFFPCNQWSYLHDAGGFSFRAMAVLADVSRATTSLHDGELEFLMMRRTLYDDSRGVGQPLNDSIRLITTSKIYIGAAPDSVATAVRVDAVATTHPIAQYYAVDNTRMAPAAPAGEAKVDSSPIAAPTLTRHIRALRERLFNTFYSTKKDEAMGARSAMHAASSASVGGIIPIPAYGLPKNIHLHTRQLLNPTTLLVRLQHLFAAGESYKYSRDTSVDLAAIIPSSILGTARILSVVEMDLNGVTTLADINKARRRYATCVRSSDDDDDGTSRNGAHRGDEDVSDGYAVQLYPSPFANSLNEGDALTTTVTLHPMDIRTYKIVLEWE